MINDNFSIKSARLLSQSQRSIAKSLERLSTGKRINSPSDDLASFSTVTGLESDLRGLQQASLNVTQAIGLLQTADSAIGTQLDIVQRIRELAVQGSNSLLTDSDRSSLNKEVVSLMQEFRRITNTTDFAGTKLLNGSFGSKEIQIGSNSGETVDLEIGSLSASSIFQKSVGSGGLSSTNSYDIGDAPGDLITGDFNNDGIEDIATANGGVDDQLGVRLGRGDGTFDPTITTNLQGSAQLEMNTGDLNNDGILDVVVLDNAGGGEFAEVLLGNGDGSFKTGLTFEITEASGAEVDFGDFNGDGYLDIVTGSGNDFVSILMNDGTGSFNAETTVAILNSGGDADHIRTADFDNDGNIDIFVTDSATGESEILFSNGDGTFTLQSAGASLGGSVANFALGDFDNDGNIDIIQSQGSSTTVNFISTNGTRSFDSAVNAFTASNNLTELATGDINNDGLLDLVGRSSTGFEFYTNNGDGTFSLDFEASQSPANGLAFSDVNGDGISDLINANRTGDSVYVGILGTTQATAEADVNVSTEQKAQALIAIADTAIENLLAEQTELATSLSRFESIQNSNLLLLEDLDSAKAQIESADFAIETASLVTQQILQQSQIAALSQSNLNAQVSLQLLDAL